MARRTTRSRQGGSELCPLEPLETRQFLSVTPLAIAAATEPSSACPTPAVSVSAHHDDEVVTLAPAAVAPAFTTVTFGDRFETSDADFGHPFALPADDHHVVRSTEGFTPVDRDGGFDIRSVSDGFHGHFDRGEYGEYADAGDTFQHEFVRQTIVVVTPGGISGEVISGPYGTFVFGPPPSGGPHSPPPGGDNIIVTPPDGVGAPTGDAQGGVGSAPAGYGGRSYPVAPADVDAHSGHGHHAGPAIVRDTNDSASAAAVPAVATTEATPTSIASGARPSTATALTDAATTARAPSASSTASATAPGAPRVVVGTTALAQGADGAAPAAPSADGPAAPSATLATGELPIHLAEAAAQAGQQQLTVLTQVLAGQGQWMAQSIESLAAAGAQAPSTWMHLPGQVAFLGLAPWVGGDNADGANVRVWRATAVASLAATVLGYAWCRADARRRARQAAIGVFSDDPLADPDAEDPGIERWYGPR